VASTEPHTRVPNLIFDVVAPLLRPAERDCLLYIVRRTYGFADPNGGRRARDTISLEQFENGITSGEYLLDLGTGLSRNTIRKALRGLREKELVEARWSCLRCYWEGELRDGDADENSTRGPACPRCSTSLSQSYALADFTPRQVVGLLNRYDKQGRVFRWDKYAKRFVFENPSEDEKRRRAEEDVEVEIERLRALLWYPELVDEAIRIAEQQLKSKKMAPTRKLNNFYKVVWELQEEFGDAPLLKYGLEQTIRGPALRNQQNHRWHRYLLAVMRNNQTRFRGGSQEGGGAGEAQARHEQATRELLAKAAQLNGRGERAEARALLSDILAQVKNLSHLFEGDRVACEYHLRLAFKQGSSDLKPQHDPHALDFYPEWDPEAWLAEQRAAAGD